MAPRKASGVSTPVAAPASPAPAAVEPTEVPIPASAAPVEHIAPQKLAWPLPKFSATSIDNTQSLLRFVILGFICGAAVASRLFAVIRFESVIHEFDPWFN